MNKLSFFPSMILFLSFLGPKDVTLSIKKNFENLMLGLIKIFNKNFVLHPPDF